MDMTGNSAFKPVTLVELLDWRARQQPEKMAFRFLVDGETQEELITYGQLEQRARAFAARLQAQVQAGDRVLILYPSCPDYIAAFFGCLYAGVVAVTAYPPRLNRPAPRLQAIISDSGALVALTTTAILDNIQRRFEHHPEMAELTWINGDEIPNAVADDWTAPAITPESTAFLQYTSGSTGSPRGVMITHDNLLQNMKLISHGFQIGPNDSSVFWLPLYHDMGLIGGILTPMYAGGPSTLLSSEVFLQRPLRWLQAITRYRATISGAPNFAYQMCLERISPQYRAELSLDSWRIAFCGAEPIHPGTIRKFTATFSQCGFKSTSFYACYGLAEATLLVSGGEGPGPMVSQHVDAAALAKNNIVAVTDKATPSQEIASCGVALLDQEIVIVNQQSLEPCAANEVGEVWVSGRGIARGYWQRPEATAQTFAAKLANRSEPSYLRTGDLGYLHEGHLYITGRQKDLIIIRGRNHYPQDIEHTIAGCHPVFQAGMGAAFSIQEEGEERLVVVHEAARRYRNVNMHEVVTTARRAIAREHEVQLHALVLVRPLSIARTSSGKIMRFVCKSAFLNDSLKVIDRWCERVESLPANTKTISQPDDRLRNATTVSAPLLESWLVSNIAAVLKTDPRIIDVNQPFVDHGLDSVQAVILAGRLEDLLKRPLQSTLVWDYPTIRELAVHLASATDRDQPIVSSKRMPDPEPIAVIGLGCRFPGANSAEAYWRLLADGVDAISEVPAERWDTGAFFDSDLPAGKMNTRWGGFLENIDQFDPHFFGISPREATRMDPQQRMILEVSWEALENAGQAPGELAGSNTAVFVGISSYDYSRLQFGQVQNLDLYAGTGNAHSIAANRLSYLLDLRGPSMAVDTACSSSLMAVHLACQSLRSGESDMAIAGGVNLILSPEMTVLFSQGKMMASDGRCKTFDARADGYVRSEGCGVVILKRLSEAIRDRDQIMAVIRGSAVNQDGRSNGLTAPNGRSQQSVTRQALANAAVKPSDISYIEAHGTGTLLGDPIEIQSLRAVYEKDRSMDQTCLVGSVKTNIGHLEAAAGIASLIKVILSLQHEEIPAHLHYQSPSPHIDLSGSLLHIAKDKHPWPESGLARMAGVSSFGFGGTNVHLIVGDAPPQDANENETPTGTPETRKALKPVVFCAPPKSYHLLVLSARQQQSLKTLAAKYRQYLQVNEKVSLADICYTANTGRSHFDHRLAVTAMSHDQMQIQLRAFLNGHGMQGLIDGQKASAHPPAVAFLFSGEGAQYPCMGQELYQTQVVFRGIIDHCATMLDMPLSEILYPAQSSLDKPPQDDHLRNPRYSLPALFAVEYALVKLWRSWGIEPNVVMGNGGGEITAACVAGVFSLEDGLRLVSEYGRLMQSVSRDEMTASGWIMNHTGLNEFESVLGELDHRKARIPLVYGVDRGLIAAGETPDIEYWRRQFFEPLRFGEDIKTLAESGANIFIEIGPDAGWLSAAQSLLPGHAGIVCLPSLLKEGSDHQVILESLGALYTAGMTVNWHSVGVAADRRKVALPTYPFSRQRYWIDVAEVSPATQPPIQPAAQESGPEADKAVPFQGSRLQATSEGERHQVTADILIELTARVLELENELIDVDQPLDAYGLDSLIALDLKTEVEKSLGIDIPVANFLQGPTLTELTSQLVDRITQPETPVSTILPVSEVGKSHPLSYNQQALWYLHELLPKDLSFNVAGAVRIRGRLKAEALRDAFRKLIARHSILRTTIKELRGRPRQQVQTAITTPFQEINALDWDDDGVENYLVREAYSPFDLNNGPIIRIRLLARGGQEHILLLAVDHIIADLWSISVLIQELYQLYRAEITGKPVELPQLEIQYTDYVYWEADFLNSASAARQRAYWLGHLNGDLPVLDLPTDRPRTARQTYAGETVNMLIDNELLTRIRLLGQTQGATLYMTLLAGFQTLLHRYCGQDRLLVGSVLAGRDRPELATQIGYFINPVILSADFSGDPGFGLFLRQVRQTVLDAFANQTYPLPLLAEGLSFVRDPGRPPLFETMFIMQKTPATGGRSLASLAPGMPKAVISWDDLSIESISLPHMPAQFDLTLIASELDEGLGVALHFNSDLFERSTVSRMLTHFATLLTAIAADPHQTVSTIPFLTAVEQEQLTSIHVHSKLPDLTEKPVYQLIENQTRKTPEATAIVYQDNSVTYDQLNRAANQVAHLLVDRGAAAGNLIGIYTHRGIDMVAAMLGVLKAGSAYLPLDPAFPRERLAIMIADAQPGLILTQADLESDLQAITRAEIIVTLDGDQLLSEQPVTNPDITVQADDIAYVIYTSGSTGRPKGVMVTHRNLFNVLSSMQNEPGLMASDSVLAVTTLSFDIAALEIFLPLVAGAKLVIATGAEARDGFLLQQLMATRHITFMQATPATWQLLLEAGWRGDKRLKILCGGDVLPRELANRLLQRSREVWNMYGPTETTIWSTIHQVLPGEGPVPIGLPVANTHAHVLDRHMQPVPRGVVGELYIAGDGVTRGYLNEPELTAEKFIRHCFGSSQGSSGRQADADTSTGSASTVLYKTGDRVRLLNDGNLLFLGRDDQQVKLRGYRIEPGDIESVLEQFEGVEQAIVVSRDHDRQNQQLVAYLLLRKDTEKVACETLRSYLRHKLPGYMIPSAFVVVDEVPLTPSGKTDRKALPAPAPSNQKLKTGYVAPRTSLEKQIADLCGAVLGVDKVGMHDNFFDSGGNSLLATRLVFQLREALQVPLPLRLLFADPSVSGICKSVMAMQDAGDVSRISLAGKARLPADMSLAQMNAEAVLDESIPHPGLPLAAIKTPDHILLTGATGFVGAFLLSELLLKTRACVHCLVRAESVASGQQRLRETLETYQLWQETFSERIRIFPGDLAQPRLGLTRSQFNELSQSVDVIYHVGAMVNFVYSFQSLKGANVLGTHEVLRLAGTHRLKAVHFVSTLSVLHTGAHEDGAVYFEDADLDRVGVPLGNYAKSKWVAEKLVMEAGRRGIPIAIYRPGLICGHSKTAVTNTADLMSSMLLVCLTTGSVPELNIMVDVVPVDYVGGAIVQISLGADFNNQVFHLSNPRPVHYDYIVKIFKSLGYNLKLMPFSAWRDHLVDLSVQLGGGSWDAFLPLLEEAEVEQAFMPAFDCRNSLTVLGGRDVSCAAVDADLLRLYLDNFKKNGFI